MVKWISQRSSEPLFWVRILVGAQIADFIQIKQHLHFFIHVDIITNTNLYKRDWFSGKIRPCQG